MVRIKQAVILAGGQGVRLRPLTLATPKPMILIHKKPFLSYIVESLVENGIQEILILTGYLHEKIEKYFGTGEKFGVKISYSTSPVVDDTGTRLKKAQKLLKKHFLLLYSDNYWPLQLKDQIQFYTKHKTLGMVTIYQNEDIYSKNNIYVDSDGLVKLYDKKAKAEKLNGVDIGYFILNKIVLDHISKSEFSLEKDLLPNLIKEKQLSGYLTQHKYYGLSNKERIPVINNFFREKRVVFLDRDGVINKKAPKAEYIKEWKDFIFLPGVFEALKILKEKRYTVFLVTNQPGIARGMLTEKQLQTLHINLLKEVKKHNGYIKDIFVCKHGWDEGCFCRKPNPGMFFTAASKYNIDLYKSYCIGDDERDIIAGQKAGCKTFRVIKQQDLLSIVKKYL